MGSFSESQARQWAEQMQAQFGSVTVASAAGAVEAPVAGRLQDLIDQVIANLGNVDADEAAAIMAKLTEATTALATGNWFAGIMAILAAFAMYRQAIAD